MLVMSINNSVNETQYDKSILQTFAGTSDQVAKQKMISWQYCSTSAERNKKVVQPGELIVMCERVWFFWASYTPCEIMFFSVTSLCNTEPMTEDAGRSQRETHARQVVTFTKASSSPRVLLMSTSTDTLASPFPNAPQSTEALPSSFKSVIFHSSKNERDVVVLLCEIS